MPRRPREQPLKPRDLRTIVLHGVDYYIYWDRMTLGSSFFLPTTATVEQVKQAIKPAVKFYQYKVELRTRREFDRYGVRVWRLA